MPGSSFGYERSYIYRFDCLRALFRKMEPSAPLEDVTRGSCVSCLFSGQVFEGHMKIGKKQLKGRFLIHGSTVHIHTGEDVVKFRPLGSGPFLDLGHPVVFITPERHDTIMNGRFENWCFRLVRNWFMGNQKNRDYFELVTVLYASVRDVKLEPSVVGLIWAISQLESGKVKPFTDIFGGFNPSDMDAFFSNVNNLLYFDRSLRLQAETFVRSLGARL